MMANESEAAMSLKDWLLIIGPLAGVIIGGSITSFVKWLELNHQFKLEKRREEIKRLERIHQECSELGDAIGRAYLETIQTKHRIMSDEERLLEFPALTRMIDAKAPSVSSLAALYLGTEKEEDTLPALMREFGRSGLRFLANEDREHFDNFSSAFKQFHGEVGEIQIRVTKKLKNLFA